MRLSTLGYNYLFTFYTNIFFITIIFFLLSFFILNFFKLKSISYLIKSTTYNWLKTIVMYVYIINFFLVIIKFIIQLFYLKWWLLFLIYKTNNLLITLNFLNVYTYGIYINNIGYSLLFLCYITSFLTLYYLGDRDLFTKGTSLSYFIFFLVCTTIMINSSNLLVIFISFEFIFLPSLYFVYILGYVKKTDKTVYFLLIWTLFGSFLVLFNFGYIFSVYKTLDYKYLIKQTFTYNEAFFLYLSFFIGFGIKIPIFPFHYWLTKVHVEAPAGFSMFLSGFLVKTALYCFYYINLLFNNFTLKYYFIFWISFCIIEASIKMWVQVDIKKLIAFATIQEMNMLLLGILLFQFTNNNIILVFIIMHGILSTLMFFLVDQVQKRAQTRNTTLLSGFCTKFSLFRIYIWIMLILYLGLPLTVKFIIEWHIGALLILNFGFFGMFIFFCALFFGAIGFTKCWLHILYGNPHDHLKTIKVLDMFYKDRLFVNVLVTLLFFLNFIIFFI